MEKKPIIRLERTPGEIVATRRKDLGMTQDDLEWITGISSKQISKIENDHVHPIMDTILALEKALEIPLVDVFMKERNKARPERKTRAKNRFREFQKKLPNSNDDELEEILNRVLSEVENGSGEDGEKSDKTAEQ
jgi:transcriptional regulator with XRE-family HTH domain